MKAFGLCAKGRGGPAFHRFGGIREAQAAAVRQHGPISGTAPTPARAFLLSLLEDKHKDRCIVMVLNIKDAEADRLARQVARLTGESITRTVVIALQEKLAREERRRNDDGMLVDDVLAIARSLSAQPTLDARSDEDILGFDALVR